MASASCHSSGVYIKISFFRSGIFFFFKAVVLKEHIMIPKWDVVGTWTHDKKVDFPQPGSPKRSIVTVVSASEDSDSAILVE